MADLKISQLSSATALAGTEVVPVVQSGATKKATIDQILSPAAGKGINFSAAGGDTLTIYDEGTWTPVFGGAGGTSGQSYGAQLGYYTRIGRQVICTFQCEFSAEGTLNGNLVLTGLPFTPSAATYGAGYFTQMSNLGGLYLNGTIRISSGTNLVLVTSTPGASPMAAVDAATFLTDSTVLLGVIEYFV